MASNEGHLSFEAWQLDNTVAVDEVRLPCLGLLMPRAGVLLMQSQ